MWSGSPFHGVAPWQAGQRSDDPLIVPLDLCLHVTTSVLVEGGTDGTGGRAPGIERPSLSVDVAFVAGSPASV